MMAVKKRRQRCNNHKATGRSWDHYAFGFVDYLGTEIWRCIECKTASDKWMIEYELQKEKEREKAREDSRKFWQEMEQRAKERRQKVIDELWDCEVTRMFALKTKLKGDLRRKFKQSIPKEVLQLARATIKLDRMILQRKDLQEKEFEKKQLALNEQKRPIQKCMKHGDLYLPDLIKSGKNRWTGEQAYKCRQCMKDFHKMNYQNNKEELAKKHAEYRKNNHEKVKECNRKYWRKKHGKNNNNETTAGSSSKSD